MPVNVSACRSCLSVFAGHGEFCLFDGKRLGSVDVLIGRTLGDYRLGELIGVGGTGCVFRGNHTTTNKPSAIKLVYGEVDTAHARFRREIDAISALDHPNIVKILDSGLSPAGLTYMVMELLDGVTLRTVIDRLAPLDNSQVRGLAKQLLAGLAAAHSSGFVHRDLKPSNIMVTRQGGKGRVKILDFGTVASLHRNRTDDRLTRTGFIVGTPIYMAPEQVDAKSVTPEADIYALGAILYELLTGAPPFNGNSEQILLEKLTSSPAPISLAGGFGTLILSMLDPKPERRPANAQQVLEALDQCRESEGTGTLPYPDELFWSVPNSAPVTKSVDLFDRLEKLQPTNGDPQPPVNGEAGEPAAMSKSRPLTTTLARLQNEISGFIGASIVDINSGMTLASHSLRPDLDLAIASAYNSQMVKHKLKTIAVLKLKSSLEDMLLTLGDQLHLIRMITSKTFLYVAADRSMTNLALLRAAVENVVDDLR